MTPDLPALAAKVRELADGATPGPWQVDGPWWHDVPHRDDPAATGMVSGAGSKRVAVALAPPPWVDRDWRESEPADLRLIAAAPTLARTLVIAIEALDAVGREHLRVESRFVDDDGAAWPCVLCRVCFRPWPCPTAEPVLAATEALRESLGGQRDGG